MVYHSSCSLSSLFPMAPSHLSNGHFFQHKRRRLPRPPLDDRFNLEVANKRIGIVKWIGFGFFAGCIGWSYAPLKVLYLFVGFIIFIVPALKRKIWKNWWPGPVCANRLCRSPNLTAQSAPWPHKNVPISIRLPRHRHPCLEKNSR